MEHREAIRLKRDCRAAQIPSGNTLILRAGSEVRMSQSLGGSYTVITEDGFMVRIAGEDADALGIQPSVPSPKSDSSGPSEKTVEEQVWGQLRTCYDPEIPVNIVDLGLIYLCQVTPLTSDPLPPEGGEGRVRGEGNYKVEIKMTLTAPGCGMGDVLRADVQGKVLKIAGVKQADVQLVWEPHWDSTRMSEAAKLQLGML